MPSKIARENDEIRPALRHAAPSREEAAMSEILSVGDNDVSVIVSWNSIHAAPLHIAFELSGKEAAALLAASLKRRAKRDKKPNSELIEAINEGRSLGRRFSSAEDLFDALEAARKKQGGS